MTRYTQDAQVEVERVPGIDQALEELAHTPALALLVNSGTVTRGLELLKSSAPLYQAALPNGIPALVCAIPDPRNTQADLGVSDILVKPISQEALLAALDRLGITQGTVLVVDDEPDILQLFGRILAASKRGYHILQARDGLEAMSILEERHPDVILLDLMMPNADGFEVLAALRESSMLRDIPTIIISAREPTGQPIMCNTLAVTQAGGISIHQLLACVHALTEILSPAQHGAPKPPANLAA
jgi:CheY-like chemotaxis protein